MSRKDGKAKLVAQRVANRAHERGLTRQDALVAYAMDRLLYRLGRSAHARELLLKGGYWSRTWSMRRTDLPATSICCAVTDPLIRTRCASGSAR